MVSDVAHALVRVPMSLARGSRIEMKTGVSNVVAASGRGRRGSEEVEVECVSDRGHDLSEWVCAGVSVGPERRQYETVLNKKFSHALPEAANWSERDKRWKRRLRIG